MKTKNLFDHFETYVEIQKMHITKTFYHILLVTNTFRSLLVPQSG